MISQGKANAVKKLLKEGLSHREIQKKTGVARGTVSHIKTGKWDAGQQRLRKRVKKEGYEYKYPSLNGGLSGRCLECGAMVYLPCHACWVRQQVAHTQRKS